VSFFDQVIDSSWLVGRQRERAAPALPPMGVIPVYTGYCAVLIRATDLAIWLSGAAIFPAGAAFALNLRWRPPRHVYPPFAPGALGRDGPCLGVQTDDGRRTLAVTIAASTQARPHSDQPFVGTTAVRHGYGAATVELWLSPLELGNVMWAFEWRAEQVPETHAQVDMSALHSARERPISVWGDATGGRMATPERVRVTPTIPLTAS
jgi:hypothetical protein